MRWLYWKAGFCRRLRKYPPVFVYQMGKVGSQSIRNELIRTYKGAVVHCHPFDEKYRDGKVQELWKYWNEPGPKPAMSIVSPVRNPVDRNLSAFFHNFEEYVGVPASACTLTLEEIKQIFLDRFPHHHPLDWYDSLIRDAFGIDVFSRPFPEKGYDIFEQGTLRLLVIRLEVPPETVEEAIRGYLHLERFTLPRDNVASAKDYAPLYKRFKAEVTLPDAYLDWMLNSKYFQHFYSPAVAAKTRQKWKKTPV